MNSKSSRHSRKFPTLLIYPKFQIRLIIVCFLAIASMAMVIMYTINQSFSELIKLGSESGLPMNHTYFKFIEYQQSLIVTRISIVLIILTPILIGLILMMSHRLAGPIVRLGSYFQKMKETGEMPKITFRDADYFQELPEIIQEGLNSLKNK